MGRTSHPLAAGASKPKPKQKPNALKPKEWVNSDSEVDLRLWDGEPSVAERFGSKLNEIRSMIQPMLKQVFGGNNIDFDVAFFTELDMAKHPQWVRIPMGEIRAATKWDQDFSIRYGLIDHEGALAWRGHVSGTPHFICIQRMDYRKQWEQKYYATRRQRMEIPTPEDVAVPADMGKKAVMREAETNIETKANVGLASTETDADL